MGAKALAQSDAPLLEKKPELFLQMQRFDAQLEAVDRRQTAARLFKGVGIAGFSVGGLALIGYGLGQVANGIDSVGRAVGEELQLRREEVSLQLQPEKDAAWSEPAIYVARTP